jgi:carboxyl-terminal processing protease
MNQRKLQVWIPLLLSLSMVVGIFIGYKLHGNLPAGSSLFGGRSQDVLREVMGLIRGRYVDDVNTDTLGQAAIERVLENLDPHSVYIPASELAGVNEDLAGKFQGIGVEFNIFDDTVHILTVLPGGPSARAGIEPGDRIVKVGDSLVAGNKITSEGIRSLLRGPDGTKVEVTVKRADGGRKRINITRGYIPLTSLDASYMLDDSTGYIRLNRFSEDTYETFMEQLESLQKKGMRALVLDLRDNGGGILDEAVEMADEFLPGDKRIVYTEGAHVPRREYTCRRNGLFEQGKLVLLMDEGSASASEVLAGALQDWDRATIIGRRSFGKGLVQEQYQLSDGSALRLTVARYYTPLGRSIQKSYADGQEKYHDEIFERFQQGQLQTADTAVPAGSKVFRSPMGKKLYGGVGIQPDLFVPFDTTEASGLLAAVFTKNTLDRFAYRYFLTNRAALAAFKSPEEFVHGFEVSDSIYDGFVSFAAGDSLSLGKLSNVQQTILRNRIKSRIARQLWRSEGLFPVLNERDPMIRMAIGVKSR